MRIVMYKKYFPGIVGPTSNSQILVHFRFFYNYITIGGAYYTEVGLREIYCLYIKGLYEID